MKIIIPNVFARYKSIDLIRLGNKYDGGYVVDKKSVLNSKLLISFGLGLDWSFEKAFKKINKNSLVKNYDGSINLSFWGLYTLKQLIKLITFQISIKVFFYNLYKILDFIFFFIKKNNFFSYWIIPNGSTDPQRIKKKDLNQILKKNKKLFFLKIDIEGAEYRILDQIIKNQKLLQGLVIEWHDVDLHLKRIIDFHKKLKLKIIYISSNNATLVNSDRFPTTLEISYSKYYKEKLFYMRDFDRELLNYPNVSKFQDHVIEFRK
jgi:hypothetical protein